MPIPNWQQQLANIVSDPAELLEHLELDSRLLQDAMSAHENFSLRVPRPYLARIRKGDPNDPLLRQILPLGEELIAVPGYSADPLDEGNANPAPGLIHKYHGRVLLIVSPRCAVNCRYCFRRHFDYKANNPGRRDWRQTLDYIAADHSISEVIFSGGDPLLVPDRQLLWLTGQLAGINHIKRLRIHTRLPVVIPERITGDCLAWMTGSRLKPVVVVHINHPNEVDDSVAEALRQLAKEGITLLNQSVLLRSINDDPSTLAHLSERLFDTGVLPYYLHLLDRVAGAGHFEVSEASARQLVNRLLRILPGYLVPRLVREVAGADCKIRQA